jgi:hypothetical protein
MNSVPRQANIRRCGEDAAASSRTPTRVTQSAIASKRSGIQFLIGEFSCTDTHRTAYFERGFLQPP